MIADWLRAPEAEMARLLFASLRTGAALALLPGIGAVLLPLRVRIGLALAVGLLVVAVAAPAVPSGPAILGSVAGEVMVGAAFGVVLQAVFAAANVAGEVISQSMGLGFATILSPGGLTSPVVTTLMSLSLWMVFVGADGHLRLFVLLVESYTLVPPGSAVAPLAVAKFAGNALVSGLQLALPLTGVLVLVNLWLAVLSRSAPQLNLFSIGFATLMAAGLVALPLAYPAMLGTMGVVVEDGLDQLADLPRG